MFEEDYERCFICQQPCKGLYCSSECRQMDKGVPSPAVRPVSAIKLTAQIPAQMSPLLRPMTKMPSNGDSSSASSIASSPLHSPATNPSTGGGSPHKEVFDLPPLAFPHHNQSHSPVVFPGSMPVKIPALVPRMAPSHTPSSHAHTPGSHTPTAFPGGASIDTLRFGRKPGLTNTLTSPSALIARCACGKPANHRGRALSKDRGLESGFVTLNLGPSMTSHEPFPRKNRIVSDSAVSSEEPKLALLAQPRHSEADLDRVLHASSSFLARSRSDPIPPSPETRGPLAAIRPSINRGPASIRTSHMDPSPLFEPESVISPTLATSPRRGRSRERHIHQQDDDAAGSDCILNHPPEREHPPSRSRHRREERERHGRESRRLTGPTVPEPPQIMPSWSRHPSDTHEGVAPSMRRNGSGGQKSPEIADERRREDIRRATNELNGVFGVV